MKRIVMVIGGVETLEYFSYQMGETFEREGYKVYYYDLKNVKESTRKLRKFVRSGETVLLTFNFEGLSKEPGIYREGVGYVWEEYKLPCYNIAVDHPYYYHKRLNDLPEKYYHISIDKNHARYFEEYYPEYKHLGFLPLAGTGLLENDFSLQDKQVQMDKEQMRQSESLAEGRGANVILTGNYKELFFCEQFIHRNGEEYAEFYQGIIEELIARPHKTLEEVVLAHCQREMGDLSKEDARLVLHNMIFIDIYIRNYWRGEVVKTLVNAGIDVDVFGDGWDKLDCEKPQHLHIHPQTTSLVCLQEIKKAKISLNVMPWFKDGAHDRVFNSILNETLCVTDKSKYLCQELKEGEGVCYYDLENLKALPELVSGLLQNESDRQRIVEKGLEKVMAHHTWEVRAKQVLKWIES